VTVEPMTDAELDPPMTDGELDAIERHMTRMAGAGHVAMITAGDLDRIRVRIRAAEAERDAALARAMPEPRLLRTVEEVEALPAGAYLICSRLNRTRAFCAALAPCAERWEVGGRLWPDRTMVGCILSGPLPDLPTPTAGETL